jgi:hypothetical protein
VPRAAGGDEPTSAGGETATLSGADAEPLVHRRQGKGWETIRCSCGQERQLSPAFGGNRLGCQRCGRKIRIVS